VAERSGDTAFAHTKVHGNSKTVRTKPEPRRESFNATAQGKTGGCKNIPASPAGERFSPADFVWRLSVKKHRRQLHGFRRPSR
jgi:hypothetical protein